MADDEQAPADRDGWLLTAPQLVLIDEAAFSVLMVIEDRVEREDHALDYTRDRYEVRGPIGQGRCRHLWLADHTGALLPDPVAEPPAHLTTRAQRALNAWLDWADDGSD
ncbi:MAG TPA: hypothetical protein VGL60_13710 [Acidimicrobiales bacterium]